MGGDDTQNFEKWHTLHENPIHFYGGSAPSTAEIWYCTQPTLLCRSFDHNEWTQWARTNFGAPIFTQNGHLNGHFDQFSSTHIQSNPDLQAAVRCKLLPRGTINRKVHRVWSTVFLFSFYLRSCSACNSGIIAILASSSSICKRLRVTKDTKFNISLYIPRFPQNTANTRTFLPPLPVPLENSPVAEQHEADANAKHAITCWMRICESNCLSLRFPATVTAAVGNNPISLYLCSFIYASGIRWQAKTIL